GVRPAAGRDQEMAALDLAIAVNDDLDLCTGAFDARDRDLAADVDALTRKRVEHDRRAFAILARERLRRFQHRDGSAEAAKGLRELEADGARADDDQVLRPRGEIEHGFVGEVRHRVEPRDRRKRRRGAGRDNEAPRRDHDVVPDYNGVAILEARGACDHPHPEAVEALLRIIWRDRRDDVMHVLVDLAEIDVRRSRRYAEGARLRDRAGVLGGGDQRFRGHAAGVETFASHLVLLDQHHRYAEGGRGGGDREAAGARADHADVGLQTFRHAFSRGRTRKDENSRSRSVTDHALSVRSRAPAVVRARSRFTTTGM